MGASESFCLKQHDTRLLLKPTTTLTSTNVAAPKASAANIIPVAIFLKGLEAQEAV